MTAARGEGSGEASVGGEFDPYAKAELIAEVPGLRARRVSLGRSERIPWYQTSHASTLFFANASGLTIQLQDPPFQWPLRAGESYAVPSGMSTTVYASDGMSLSFTIFQYGQSFEMTPAAPPKHEFLFPRTLPDVPVQNLRPLPQPEDLSRYRQAYRRMDILAMRPKLRLIVQGHGAFECVPWHVHDNVTDTFYCASGYGRVETRNPDRITILAPGETCQVPPAVEHFVSGAEGQPCILVVMQGVGTYNYVPRP